MRFCERIFCLFVGVATALRSGHPRLQLTYVRGQAKFSLGSNFLASNVRRAFCRHLQPITGEVRLKDHSPAKMHSLSQKKRFRSTR